MFRKKLILSAAILALSATVLADKPPETRKQTVQDTYHAVTVDEDYRWLENPDDPEVRAWSAAQNAHARAYLDRLPQVGEIRARFTEILSAPLTSYFGVQCRAPRRVFAYKRQPPKQQSILVTLDAIDSTASERPLVDPNTLDPTGSTTIDWYVPSPDGHQVAISLSRAGTESGDVHIYDVTAAHRVHEIIPRVNGGTAGGDLVWASDASGVYYTRYPRGKERPPEDMDFYQQVYYHALGTPTKDDRYEMGKGLPRIAEIQLESGPNGLVMATVQDGDGGQFAHFLRMPDGKWRQFSLFGDKIIQATFGERNDLYIVSRQDAPRGKIIRLPITDALALPEATTTVAQSKDTIVTDFMNAPPTVLAHGGRLYVEYQLGGPTEIRVFSLDGKPLAAPRQLPVSSVGGMERFGPKDILFANSSYTAPHAYYHYAPDSGKTARTALLAQAPVDLSDAEVRREFAVSKDGTRVPVNILLPKNISLDGKNPCVVTGYGGYGLSVSPGFSSSNRVLLDQGIIYAQANLRGGAEYGEQWHLEGNLTNKQNVFDDFIAVLEHLIKRGYTSPEKLAIRGGSNGGLLMGAVMTQRPDLMRVVESHVGIYDMLRVELSPNGAFNVPEFGSVRDAAQFAALHAYSPYHSVRQGVSYPATLFLTGANDPRVDPMQSRKMTARLQAATSSAAPILLRTSDDSGHGGGTPLKERINQAVDAAAFLFDRLGVRYHPIVPSSLSIQK